jgi:hypothetical protein
MAMRSFQLQGLWVKMMAILNLPQALAEIERLQKVIERQGEQLRQARVSIEHGVEKMQPGWIVSEWWTKAQALDALGAHFSDLSPDEVKASISALIRQIGD